MIGKILVVDDEPSMCEFLKCGLKRSFEVTTCTSAPAAFDAIVGGDYDAAVTDLNMRGMNGLDLCERIASNRPDVPVIVMTAFGSLETAVAAIRVGAYDFLTKPLELETLRMAVERAVQHRSLSVEVKRLRKQVEEHRQDELLGQSQVMAPVRDLVHRVAEIDTSVLITGESGTGKEIVARSLHQHSRRKAGPFVVLNCAAVPESLVESELFGHAKGSFTDAKHARQGLFVEADGGTLFLDEISELSLGAQPKLLRALQERKVRPIGSNAEIAFDARIIAATNRDLETMVEDKRLREDLYYRLSALRIALPPLRARGADVLLLAQHFVDHYASRFQRSVVGLATGAAEKLMAYSWPGNVRELQNCIERAVALARFDNIVVDDLPEIVRNYRQSRLVLGSQNPAELAPLEEIERRYILHVLEAVGDSKTLAAQTLGLDRKTLYRKLEQYAALSEKSRSIQLSPN